MKAYNNIFGAETTRLKLNGVAWNSQKAIESVKCMSDAISKDKKKYRKNKGNGGNRAIMENRANQPKQPSQKTKLMKLVSW